MIREIHTPIAGTVWKVLVKPGDAFSLGDTVAMLESMKMEIAVEADGSGTVVKVLVAEGDVVDEGVAVVTYT